MWKRILSEDYFLSNNNFEIYVTNFISIWFTHFSQESFISCLKDSNPVLEMEEKNLLDRGERLLASPGDLKRAEVQADGTTLDIKMMTKSFGYPFRLNLKLTEGSKELFFASVTRPLLLAVDDLRASEAELVRLLQRKDHEIHEYKCEGGEIALRHLKTVPFDAAAHSLAHAARPALWEGGAPPAALLRRAAAPPERCVKSEPAPPHAPPPHAAADIKVEVKNELHSPSAVKQEAPPPPAAAPPPPARSKRKKLNL